MEWEGHSDIKRHLLQINDLNAVSGHINKITRVLVGSIVWPKLDTEVAGFQDAIDQISLRANPRAQFFGSLWLDGHGHGRTTPIFNAPLFNGRLHRNPNVSGGASSGWLQSFESNTPIFNGLLSGNPSANGVGLLWLQNHPSKTSVRNAPLHGSSAAKSVGLKWLQGHGNNTTSETKILSDKGRRFAVTTTDSGRPAEVEADAGWAAGIIAIVEAKLPLMCDGVQNRLAAGAGVHESLKTEFLAQIGVKLTDTGVKVMVDRIALMGAFFKTCQGPDCRDGATGFRTTKGLPSSKSKIVKNKPRTHWMRRRVLSTTRRMHNAYMTQLVRIGIETRERYRNVRDEMRIEIE
jgi:hypothetical protein